LWIWYFIQYVPAFRVTGAFPVSFQIFRVVVVAAGAGTIVLKIRYIKPSADPLILLVVSSPKTTELPDTEGFPFRILNLKAVNGDVLSVNPVWYANTCMVEIGQDCPAGMMKSSARKKFAVPKSAAV